VSDIKQRFGDRLRKVRSELGISQERLADLALLHRTYISSVERGQRNVTIETVERLALALSVPMRELLPDDVRATEGEDEHPAQPAPADAAP
jgi:transcriptional regulator with XRE-family HTH domain